MIIRDYHRQNARDIGVSIEKSDRKGKKLAVNVGDKKIHIGAVGYNDYMTYKKKDGLEVANERRQAYRSRHDCDNAKRHTAKHLACEILWGHRKKGILRGK